MVEALAFSVLAATLVTRLKLASPAFAKPEPPSVAVQAMETSAACQLASAEPQETTGDFLSTLNENGPTVTQLSRLSQTCRVPVPAVAVSLFTATLVDSENAASAATLRPEGSDAVQDTV